MKTNQGIHSTFKRLKAITKYGLVLMALVGMVHCGLIYRGIDLVYIHLILCLFAIVLGFHLSSIFGLCWVHKLCVSYLCLVLLCIVMRRYNLFDIISLDLHDAGGYMFLLGIPMIGLLVWKNKC